MKPQYRKTMLTTAKILLAVVMLAWVFSKVHLNDYVMTRSGETYAVVGRKDTEAGRLYSVTTGMLWFKSAKSVPESELVERDNVSGKYVHVGFLSAVKGVTERRWLLAAAAAVFALSTLVVSVRWWVLLRIQRIRIKPWEAIRLTFLGEFFNNVVPGTVGGDLVKSYYVSKHTTLKAAVLVSAFVDRILGFTELTILAAIMICVVRLGRLSGFEQLRVAAITIAFVLVLVVLTLTFLFSASFRRKLHLQKIYRRLPIAHHISAAGDAAKLFRKRITVMWKAILITFGAHVCFITSVALIGESLSLEIPWYSYFVYIPLIYIVGAVPVTPGGVGLIEGLYQAFLVSAVCGPDKILALALLARVVRIACSLPGAIVAVSGAKLPREKDLEKELRLADEDDEIDGDEPA